MASPLSSSSCLTQFRSLNPSSSRPSSLSPCHSRAASRLNKLGREVGAADYPCARFEKCRGNEGGESRLRCKDLRWAGQSQRRDKLAKPFLLQTPRKSRGPVNALRRGENLPNEGWQTATLPFFGVVKVPDLSQVTPLKAAKWATIIAVAWTVLSKVAALTVFNPSLWVYASWLLVIWPWPAAITLGVWTLVTAARYSKSEAKEWQQVLILFGALVWLILVPLAHFQRFVDGWPLLLFSLYAFFFLISSIVRYRLYGTLSSKTDDKQWATALSRVAQISFIVAVVGGHWLAAFEAPFLAYSWNWEWQSKLAAVILTLAVVLHYNATYFLGKYFDRLVRPRAVVMFGPYRMVRHPIYASYMLLLLGIAWH